MSNSKKKKKMSLRLPEICDIKMGQIGLGTTALGLQVITGEVRYS